MRHTEGPWRITDDGAGVRLWGPHVPKEKEYEWRDICTLGWADGLNKRTEERIDADAHLIAAAPELLEALEGIVRLSKNLDSNYSIIYKEASEAIAKAKG